MKQVDLSIIIPSIRTANWRRFLESVQNSIKKYSCEVIFIGPFVDEGTLNDFPIARHIKSYDTVGVCLQKACKEAEGVLLYHNVDDSVFVEGAIDIAIDFYARYCNKEDILNARYREGKNFISNEFPELYWRLGSYPHVYGQRYINPDWRLSVQPILSKEYFIEIGGLDCRFVYSNHSHIDLSCRVNQLGGRVIHSPIEVAFTDHGQGDHMPIQLAQEGPDTIMFNDLWNNPRENIIDYDNYKKYEGRWEGRFSKEYESYEELCKGENYKI